MKQHLIAALGALLPIVVNAGPVLAFSGKPELLIEAQAEMVFKQCSRASPTATAILQSPSEAEISKFEASLQQYIASRFPAIGPHWPDATFGRQYVAYMAAGHRLIYGNYFAASSLVLSDYPKGAAVVVCDGGASFWGAVFNPASGLVESVSFNGPDRPTGHCSGRLRRPLNFDVRPHKHHLPEAPA